MLCAIIRWLPIFWVTNYEKMFIIYLGKYGKIYICIQIHFKLIAKLVKRKWARCDSKYPVSGRQILELELQVLFTLVIIFFARHIFAAVTWYITWSLVTDRRTATRKHIFCFWYELYLYNTYNCKMRFKKSYHTWSDFQFSGSQSSHKRTEGLPNNV
jgi:hypothetical protein